eukprot:comp18548_c0_seq1/m.19997 comp18548_c0_seq1/g.19997  ORF comp18548_c0_seq1/g.19997 comp18548_c0_seq1/m.19997 type:complete len:378 (-) comp18548_c0_seq1:447-1580(-)
MHLKETTHQASPWRIRMFQQSDPAIKHFPAYDPSIATPPQTPPPKMDRANSAAKGALSNLSTSQTNYERLHRSYSIGSCASMAESSQGPATPPLSPAPEQSFCSLRRPESCSNITDALSGSLAFTQRTMSPGPAKISGVRPGSMPYQNHRFPKPTRSVSVTSVNDTGDVDEDYLNTLADSSSSFSVSDFGTCPSCSRRRGDGIQVDRTYSACTCRTDTHTRFSSPPLSMPRTQSAPSLAIPNISTKFSICPKPKRKPPRRDLPKAFLCPVVGCTRAYALDNSLRQHIRHFHGLHCNGSRRMEFVDCAFLWDLCMKTDAPPAWCKDDLARIKMELMSLVEDGNCNGARGCENNTKPPSGFGNDVSSDDLMTDSTAKIE